MNSSGPFSRINMRFIANRIAVFVAIALAFAVCSSAQQAPAGTIGRIAGDDISVEGGTPAGGPATAGMPNVFVLNGNVVTVHSGRALLELASGGRIDICGPAKFTLLESGGAITLGLNFGRVHAALPASTMLRIFAPTLVATPLGIRGGMREVTIGLDLDDSMCVHAISGALQIEHQFSGEQLVVPENAEFFLAAGKLTPVAGAPGGCQCVSLEVSQSTPVIRPAPPPVATAKPSGPVIAIPLPAEGARPASSSDNSAINAPSPQPSTSAPVTSKNSATADDPAPAQAFVVPPHANESHPLPPATRNEAPPAPALNGPVYVVDMPALVFTSASPAPPKRPSVDTVLLAQQAQVQPAWEFKGQVAAPEFVQAMQHSLGVSPAATQQKSPPPPEGKTVAAPQKKHGFWSGLKRLFAGESSNQE